MTWQEAAQSPLCLMTPEMHNRRIVDAAFAQAGSPVTPVMETSSILTLALSLMSGSVSCIMPGALVGAFRGHAELQARSLISPEVHTPVGFMALKTERTSRTLDAALTLAQDAAWLRHAAAHSGLLSA
jgi:DNA-binding transcriptional LysR family regulator